MKGLDDDINVATVEPDGTVKIYGPIYREGEPRRYVRTVHFQNYGQGKLYADEYEDGERAGRPTARR